MSRVRLLLAVLAALGVGAVAVAFVTSRALADAVPERQAEWAITRVHVAVFGPTAPDNFGCFTRRPGHSTTAVFVVDASYTNYQQVRCDDQVTREGAGYRLTVTESWDDVAPPDGSGPIGWLRRAFYRPSSHSWAFTVRPDGRVITLPESGKPSPQSYVH